MENIDSVNEYFRRKFSLKKLPRLLIIEGADGSGKTTILEKIFSELKEKRVKYSYDNSKRRKIPGEILLEFRKAVVERRNENITEKYIKRIKKGERIELVITDKSPYVEYFYQQTKWEHARLNIKENHQLEKKIFELEEVIDAAIVIHLKNKNA